MNDQPRIKGKMGFIFPTHDDEEAYMLKLDNVSDLQVAAILLSAAMRLWGCDEFEALAGLKLGRWLAERMEKKGGHP